MYVVLGITRHEDEDVSVKLCEIFMKKQTSEITQPLLQTMTAVPGRHDNI